MARPHDSPKDTAGAIAPPPLLALMALAAGLGAHWIAPLGLLARVPDILRYGLAATLAALAVVLFGLAVGGFARAGTAVQTRRPSTRLVTTGVYARTRNPIYVAFMLLLLAIALATGADWLVASTIVFALVIHFGVVKREEAYLQAKFGDEYSRYRTRAPRYGWRF